MNLSVISTNLVNKTLKTNTNFRFNNFATNSLKADTFERSSNVNFKGTDEKQALINKWNDLTTVKNNAIVSRFTKGDLESFSKLSEDGFNTIKELIPLKETPMKARFEAMELRVLSELGSKNVDKIKQLAKTPLSSFTIKELIEQTPEMNYNDLVTSSLDMEKTIPDFKRLGIEKDNFVNGNVKLIAYSNNDNLVFKRTFDKSGKLLTIESIETQKINDRTYKIKKSKDLRTNITSKTKLDVTDYSRGIVENEIRIIRDKNNNIIKKEYTEKSPVEGIYNSKEVYPDGRVKITSQASIDPKTNILSVKKDTVSPNGTRTQYLYSDDPQGNRIIDYKITDKDGKVLMNKSKTFEIINENKMISSYDGKSHEMLIEDNLLKIKDLDSKEERSFNLDSYILGDIKDKEAMIKLLKKTSGEELMEMKDSVKNLRGIKEHLRSAMSTGEDKTLHTEANSFSMLHELGHAKDIKTVKSVISTNLLKLNGGDDVISNDSKLEEIYKSERENFNNTHTTAQQEYISYFLLDDSLNRGETNRGFRETIAESNALLNTYCSVKELGMRAHYLQQNFPETIAYLADKLNT